MTAGRADGLAAFIPTTDLWDGASWTSGEPLPTPRGGVMAAVSTDGRLHVLGGEGNPDVNSGVFDAHEVYDPASDVWEVLPPMATPRHGTGAAFVDGTLWVPGGADWQAFAAVATHEGWSPP